MFDERLADPLLNNNSALVDTLMGILPSYKDLLGLVGMA